MQYGQSLRHFEQGVIAQQQRYQPCLVLFLRDVRQLCQQHLFNLTDIRRFHFRCIHNLRNDSDVKFIRNRSNDVVRETGARFHSGHGLTEHVVCGLVGNRLHTAFQRHYAAVAYIFLSVVFRGRIDIETIDPYNEEVAACVMNDREMGQIKASPLPALAFTRLWTMKESFYKLTGYDNHGDIAHMLDDTAQVRFITREYPRFVVSVCRYLHADSLDL